jgi:DNA invertase Pin-like site-specific DNA recombinase
MTVRIYARASTKEQNAERALSELVEFSKDYGSEYVEYVENYSGTKLDRPQLNKVLDESQDGDILLVESVDRLSRLNEKDFKELKGKIESKGLRLIVADLPTTYRTYTSDDITSGVMKVINNMLIDLLATMAKLDNDKRKERIKQGLLLSGYKPQGKSADKEKHDRIKQLLEAGNMKKQEIANAVQCGIATVYRVAKEMK